MLTLVSLESEQIERIVQSVPGGARNIQDIYPLAPLQSGILFHHLLNEQSDPYVLPMLLEAQSRGHLDRLISALQAVIDRHDVLRSAVLWKDLPQPVQVVYRRAQLQVEEFELAAEALALGASTGMLASSEAVLEQLRSRLAPQRQRLDIKHATQ